MCEKVVILTRELVAIFSNAFASDLLVLMQGKTLGPFVGPRSGMHYRGGAQ
jgi:hypothetical protein